MKKLIGILLLLFAVYTPISLFGSNLPPFSTDKDLYVYHPAPTLLNGLPESVNVKSISTYGMRVETYNQIPNPEDYGLELKEETKDFMGNIWYYPTLVIFVVCIFGGIFCLINHKR